jgi:hypothetical protein
VISRVNGHRHDLADTPGQWKMLNDESEKCWICDKQVYTLIFFNPTDVAKPESIFMKDYEARAHI